jgi:hypothetical protein
MKNLDQLHNEAPILKLTVDLYKEFYQYLKTFPKKDQYMLGKRSEEYLLNFLELVLIAVSLDKLRKVKTLEEASSKLDVLKVLFRLARELKILDNKKYLLLEEKTQRIGRMLGGWLKSLQ